MRGIDYVETGTGATVLFVPGSYSTHAAWRQIQKLLAPAFRMVGTSLCGYGATIETRTHEDFDMRHEVRIVEAAARRAGGKLHLVGHSFGGTVALAAALGGTIDVASVSVFEANPLALLKEQPNEALYQETYEISRQFEAAIEENDPDAAGRIIDFWGGDGTFAAMPEPVRNYCRETSSANVLDWRTDFGFDAASGHYATLNVPVLLARGTLANPAMVAMTEALRHALPDARSVVVPGAGHFLITSHASECAALLTAFLAEVGR